MFFIQYFMYYRTNKPGFFAIFSSLVLLFFYFVKEVISSFFLLYVPFIVFSQLLQHPSWHLHAQS